LNHLIFCFTAIALLVVGCRNEPIPKPKGYFRIALPEKQYISYHSDCGFKMEVPTYGIISMRTDASGDSCWFNMEIPSHRATIHFTHHKVNENLEKFLNDSYQMAYKHDIKAGSIKKSSIRIDSTRVYGLIYDLKGNSATNLRFHLTDSTKHFLAGSLYFRHYPNMDSINPVLQWIRQDVTHISETLRWE
jgi:gliding motility-associated lipoprotein GldD